jgi:hypothetical protein
LKDFEGKVPDCEDDEEGDQRGEDKNDDMLELPVEAQQIESPACFSKLLSPTHGLILT